jgi:hypothetical protein
MTPNELEACAARAYQIFAANAGETAPWSEVKNKEGWLDAVRSHELYPDAIQRKQSPNLQEQSVAAAYDEARQPVSERELVIPPVASAAPVEVEKKPKGDKK